MESRIQYCSAVFSDGEDFARAAREAGVDTTAELLLGLHDGGFWWTPAPVGAASAPAFVPVAPFAELPERATAALRRWAER